ncbi:MAG: TolC family protein [Gammaproteobacteria bacterium]|nr:TolC family protein [Gammaproteobacteria bacterium]
MRRLAVSLALGWMSAAGLAAAAEPLSLEDALALAEPTTPMLAARRAAVLAAEQRVGPAGELPDPELIAGIDNLPTDGADAGSLTADFMTMRKVGLMQRFVRRDKRTLRQELAAADAEREAAMLTSERLSVRVAVARAWIATPLAERRHALLLALRSRFDLGVAAAEAQISRGGGSSADALAAKDARIALEDRISEAELTTRIARAELARWLPDDAQRPLASPPDWRGLGNASVASLLPRIDQHRELLGYAAQTRAADVDVQLARAEKQPDWSLELAYADRGPAYSNMLSLMVRVDLPVFASRRQDPMIAAKLAERDRIDAEREDARRRHAAELQSVVAAWQTAAVQIDRFERELRPLALDRTDAALAAYRGGRGELSVALTALTAETERELDYLDRLATLAAAWAELRYSFVEEH